MPLDSFFPGSDSPLADFKARKSVILALKNVFKRKCWWTMQRKGEAELLSLKDGLRRSWSRHNLLANKRGDLPPIPSYNIPSGRQRQAHLCKSPGCEEHEKRDTLLLFFPWGVEVNLTEGLTWLLMQPLEHYSNKQMIVNQRQSPTTSQARPAPLVLAVILVVMSWKIKTMLSLLPASTTTTSVCLSQLHHCHGWWSVYDV